MKENRNWFVRRGDEIRGPFPAGLVSRYVLLGRIRIRDEVSTDRQSWCEVRQVPELIPEVMLDAARNSGDAEAQQKLAAARRWADDNTAKERPLDGLHEGEGRKPIQYAVVLAVIGAIASLPFILPSGPDVGEPDCSAPPAPQVNWSNCAFEGRRLANADLGGAVLRNAELTGVVLRAANLKGADLSYARMEFAVMPGANLSEAVATGADFKNVDLTNANLSGADLQYADFTGADLAGANLTGTRLGYAVWGDDIICMPESVGKCIPGRAVR